MKKLLLSLAVLSVSLLSQLEAVFDLDMNLMVEGKAGCFIPQESKFRDIYGTGEGMYGAEVRLPVYNNWGVFCGANYLSEKGHSKGLHTSTHIRLIPVNLGVEYFIPFCDFDLYVGAGVQFLNVKIHDRSAAVKQHFNKNAVGAMGKIGGIYNITENLYLDVYGEYAATRISNHDSRRGTVDTNAAQVGGFNVGAGLGFRFGGNECCYATNNNCCY